MLIHKKMVLSLVLFVSIMILLQTNYQYKFYLNTYRKIEETIINNTFETIQRSIENEINHLSLLCRDWANWDDTYTFMTGDMPGYMESNLIPETFIMNDTNLKLFIDNSGKTKYMGQYFGDDADVQELPESEILIIKNLRFFKKNENENSGIILTSAGIMMFSFQDILKSDGTGPPAGILFFGRLLSEKRLDTIRSQLSMNFRVSTISADSTASSGNELAVIYNDGTVLASARMNDYFGKSIMMIEFENPTIVLNQGKKTIQESISFFVFSFILFLIVLYFFLKHVLIVPLKRLSSHAENILVNAELTEKIELKSNDEISQLYESFNTMLERISLKEKELVNLATTDGLTGIYNHRYAMNYLSGRIEYFKRYGGVLSILLFDLDFFKEVNDTWGHQAGDEVLREIAQIIHTSIRNTDIAARYGGEEFLVILENQQNEQAHYVAEKIRKIIELSLLGSKKIKVTVSCGVSTYMPQIDIEQLIRKADDLLYKAKGKGRNRVEV